MDWNDIQHFLALARLGSARAAGSKLGVSHSTVVRRVEALEAQLATRLFDRNRDGYHLTEAGRGMLPGAERIEIEMSSLERSLHGQDERLVGPVKITCCDNYVGQLLLEATGEFCKQYPNIELCFNTDSRPFNLAKREADIAIRTLPCGGTPPEYLIGLKVAPVVLANYVGVKHTALLDLDENHPHRRWLSFEHREEHERFIANSSYPDMPAWGAFTSLELLACATGRGLGLAMLPTYVGDQDPDLARMPHSDLRHVADLWLLSHPDLRDNARFKVTRAHIAQRLKHTKTLFTGQP